MNMMLKVSKIHIMIIILPLILILGNLWMIGTNVEFMHEEFQKLGVYEDVPNANMMLDEIYLFFNGKDNLEIEEFNEREISHMYDVKRLATAVKWLFFISIGIFFILFFLLIIEGDVIGTISKLL
jgi:hypothetical protein